MAKPKKCKYNEKTAVLGIAGRIALLRKQKNKCACCGKPMPALVHAKVDISRHTKKVRELICRGCDLIMQGSQGSVQKLQDALIYLERHKEEED